MLSSSPESSGPAEARVISILGFLTEISGDGLGTQAPAQPGRDTGRGRVCVCVLLGRKQSSFTSMSLGGRQLIRSSKQVRVQALAGGTEFCKGKSSSQASAYWAWSPSQLLLVLQHLSLPALRSTPDPGHSLRFYEYQFSSANEWMGNKWVLSLKEYLVRPRSLVSRLYHR